MISWLLNRFDNDFWFSQETYLILKLNTRPQKGATSNLCPVHSYDTDSRDKAAKIKKSCYLLEASAVGGMSAAMHINRRLWSGTAARACPPDIGHCRGMYGQLKDDPLSSMSRMRVSIGVLPTRRTKKSCSMTCEDTVRSEGSRRSSLPNLVGWLGYWVRQYSSSAHWDFSWRPSMWATSLRPQASVGKKIRGELVIDPFRYYIFHTH
ncbi:hypothetical protein JTE90_011874 [Oedothorax gibbosus]|uniref:Uncharacterized protein n=1 Tax=Oedothorax gibbosus TaxID=931172 RepID=A0AAV6V3C1_9ARAC|nr:hypothetical protein JTE90_011874 [Oedothorax gibbosus]